MVGQVDYVQLFSSGRRYGSGGRLKLSLKAAAAALNVPTAAMAEPVVAQRVTGYVVGGVSPFGQRRRLRTVVDASALRWDRGAVPVGAIGTSRWPPRT